MRITYFLSAFVLTNIIANLPLSAQAQVANCGKDTYSVRPIARTSDVSSVLLADGPGPNQTRLLYVPRVALSGNDRVDYLMNTMFDVQSNKNTATNVVGPINTGIYLPAAQEIFPRAVSRSGELIASNGVNVYRGLIGSSTSLWPLPTSTPSMTGRFSGVINQFGQIAAGVIAPTNSLPNRTAFWNAFQLAPVLIPQLYQSASYVSTPVGINDYGVVISKFDTEPQNEFGSRWTGWDGKLNSLAAISKFGRVRPSAINIVGDIVGTASTASKTDHAFLWLDDGTAQGRNLDLGVLPGQTTSSAKSINAFDVIVGASGNRAFLYSVGGGMRDLNDFAYAAGVTFSSAEKILDNGDILATGSNGVYYLLRPSSCVTIPTVTSLTLGGKSITGYPAFATLPRGNSTLQFSVSGNSASRVYPYIRVLDVNRKVIRSIADNFGNPPRTVSTTLAFPNPGYYFVEIRVADGTRGLEGDVRLALINVK